MRIRIRPLEVFSVDYLVLSLGTEFLLVLCYESLSVLGFFFFFCKLTKVQWYNKTIKLRNYPRAVSPNILILKPTGNGKLLVSQSNTFYDPST